MKRSVGQVMPFRSMSKKQTSTSGIKTLLPPVLVEANQDRGGMFLETCTVPSEGATVRIAAYDGMTAGQRVDLIWSGPVNYIASLKVEEVGRYLDFIVPRKLVVESAGVGMPGFCDVSYHVIGDNDNVGISSATRIGIIEVPTANLPPIIPQAPNGEFNPHAIPEPGLRIEYPRPVESISLPHAFWISYGRDGRVIAMVIFNVHPGEHFVYMWRIMLEQTEPGGEVRTNYYADNDDGYICQSLHAVLRVVGE